MRLLQHSDILPSTSPTLKGIDRIVGVDGVEERHGNQCGNEAGHWGCYVGGDINQRNMTELGVVRKDIDTNMRGLAHRCNPACQDRNTGERHDERAASHKSNGRLGIKLFGPKRQMEVGSHMGSLVDGQGMGG